MTLRNFQIFVEVCRQGTMSAAAEKLYISQSAVSQTIKELENHYRTTLFNRISHKLYLTETGKKLYNHALHMVLYNEQIETSMADKAAQYQLRIGSISAYMMTDLVNAYKKLYPDIHFSMIHQTRETLDLLLQSSQIDIAIVSGLFNISNYKFFPLANMSLVFVCAAESHLSPLLEPKSPVLTLEQLAEFPLYLWTMSEDLIHQMNSIFSTHGLHYNVAGQFLHFDGICRAVFADLGIGLIHETNYLSHEKYLKKITIEGIHLKSTISLACHKQSQENPVINSFIHFAQKDFAKLKQNISQEGSDHLQLPDYL